MMASSDSNNPFRRASQILPPPSHPTPHIRLNSGLYDLLAEPESLPENTGSSGRSLTRRFSQRTPLRSSLSQRSLWDNERHVGEATDLLLPPSPTPRSRSVSRAQRLCEDDSSPFASPMSLGRSRMSSWSSDSRSSWRRGNFADCFEIYKTPSRTGSEDGLINTQTVSEKYNIQFSDALLSAPSDVEKDDYLHDPNMEDKENYHWTCTSRGVVNVGGLILIILGTLALFIGYPVLTFVQKLVEPARISCQGGPNCIDAQRFDLLQNVRRTLIDPDTPASAYSRTSHHGKKQKLVFSDEFNVDGRTFYDGDDPYWQAMDFWYGVTMDLEWYDPDAVTTKDGTLNIRFDAFRNHNLNYRSGMLQSWNKLCIKGGHIEASVSLPGRGDTIGFWPGVWAMGNLGRPGYPATTDGMWPYSYDDVCDAGITPNQSDTSGLSYLPGMRLPACSCKGQDHPSPGISRTAPEIDVIEASVGYLDSSNQIGSASQSYQCAPFDVFWRPDYDFLELYEPHFTTMNSYCGGVYQQAVSGVTNLNNKWYDGNEYQTYALDYTPGATGKITWFVGSTPSWTLDARALGPNGNIGQRVLPVEPMALVINFGMSNGFAALNLTGLATLMPATMRIDYVRIYQDEGMETVTCDPPGFPTTQYIRHHPVAYNNPNLTHWSQTGYDWPRNSLMHDCDANDNFRG